MPPELSAIPTLSGLVLIRNNSFCEICPGFVVEGGADFTFYSPFRI